MPIEGEVVRIGDVVDPTGLPEDFMIHIQDKALFSVPEGEEINLSVDQIISEIENRVPVLEFYETSRPSGSFKFLQPKEEKQIRKEQCVRVISDIDTQKLLGSENAKTVPCRPGYHAAEKYVAYKAGIEGLESLQPISAGTEIGPLTLLDSSPLLRGREQTLYRAIGRVVIEKDVVIERSGSGDVVLVKDTSGHVFLTRRKNLQEKEQSND